MVKKQITIHPDMSADSGYPYAACAHLEDGVTLYEGEKSEKISTLLHLDNVCDCFSICNLNDFARKLINEKPVMEKASDAFATFCLSK